MKGKSSPELDALEKQHRHGLLRGATYRQEWIHGQLVTPSRRMSSAAGAVAL